MFKETETLDRLYLEMSQFTTAKTRKEIKLEKTIDTLTEMLLLKSNFTCIHKREGSVHCNGCPVIEFCNREQCFSK